MWGCTKDPCFHDQGSRIVFKDPCFHISIFTLVVDVVNELLIVGVLSKLLYADD